MKTEIPKEAIDYFDKEAYELVSIMEVVTNKPHAEQQPIASVLEMNIIELDGPIGDIIESQGHMIKSIMERKSIGFTHITGERFSKFVKTIYKTHQVKSKVSEVFVKNLTFKWLVDTKDKGRPQFNFSSHLQSSIEEAVGEYKIYYHVVSLLLNTPFSLGNVHFGFFTKEYFNSFKSERKENSSDNPWATFPGRCFAMLHVKAESERAKEIAFQHCGRAIDVLKICSPTLVVPQHECIFEIDKRLTRNTETEILVETIREKREISLTMQGAGRPFSLTDKEMEEFKVRGLDIFDKFLKDLESAKASELQKMIVIAIQRMAASFVIKDFHQRIAEIYSILESLLLLNDSGSMTEMVSKYFCRLVHSEPERRKELDKIYKKLYSIRSAWVHHAKRNPIDLAELAYLQQSAQRLLQVLITKTKDHSAKETILAQIDDALFRA